VLTQGTVVAARFDALGLDPRLARALARAGWNKPTPVQAHAIPLALQVPDASPHSGAFFN
jgi:superfamily II DNA/RNA helicase